LAEAVAGAFLAMAPVIFVAELTDKDAMLILSLATTRKPLTVFAAGSIAFAVTTALFVTFGNLLRGLLPVVWIQVSGGVVMLAYGAYQTRGLFGGALVEEEEKELEAQSGRRAGPP
jgi:putative Ca2+/H+ antiporter (TMEM165/GDT1 family)